MLEHPHPTKTSSRIALTVLAVLLCGAVFAQSPATVSVRPAGVPVSDMVLIIDGRTVQAECLELQRGPQVMIWVRDLEKLGWGTVVPGSPEQVLFKSKSIVLGFTRGGGVATINSLAVRLPIDTYMKDGKFMVPLSFVAKSLGYDYSCTQRTVVSVNTTPVKANPLTTNTIRGKLLYNGRPVSGVTVRAVGPDYTAIQASAVRTAADGTYQIRSLPDGQYMAYVYTGDNPLYFNRASELVTLKGGQDQEVRPISLGKIIAPIKPKPGSTIAAKSQNEFAWTGCEGVVSYKFMVRRKGSDVILFQSLPSKPTAVLPAGKMTAGQRYDIEVVAADAKGTFLGGTAGTDGAAWVVTAR